MSFVGNVHGSGYPGRVGVTWSERAYAAAEESCAKTHGMVVPYMCLFPEGVRDSVYERLGPNPRFGVLRTEVIMCGLPFDEMETVDVVVTAAGRVLVWDSDDLRSQCYAFWHFVSHVGGAVDHLVCGLGVPVRESVPVVEYGAACVERGDVAEGARADDGDPRQRECVPSLKGVHGSCYLLAFQARDWKHVWELLGPWPLVKDVLALRQRLGTGLWVSDLAFEPVGPGRYHVVFLKPGEERVRGTLRLETGGPGGIGDLPLCRLGGLAGLSKVLVATGILVCAASVDWGGIVQGALDRHAIATAGKVVYRHRQYVEVFGGERVSGRYRPMAQKVLPNGRRVVMGLLLKHDVHHGEVSDVVADVGEYGWMPAECYFRDGGATATVESPAGELVVPFEPGLAGVYVYHLVDEPVQGLSEQPTVKFCLE